MKLLSELKRFFIEIFCSKRDFEKERKDKECIYFLMNVIESDLFYLFKTPLLDNICLKLLLICKERNNFTEIRQNLSKQIKLFESRLNGNKQAKLILERYSNLIGEDFVQFKWMILTSHQFFMMVSSYEQH